MKRNGKHEVVARITRRSLALAGLLAVVVSSPGVCRAQSSGTRTAEPTSDAKAAPASQVQAPPTAQTASSVREEKTAKKGQEGIKVHGRWTIEVKNPDGTVASRQEFENALDPIEGADLLTGLLSGEYTPDGFLVDLSSGNPITSPGSGVICGGSDCLLYDSRVPGLCAGLGTNLQNSCGTLTYTPNTGTANNNAIGFTLSGSVALNEKDSGVIALVGAGIVGCYPISSLAENHVAGINSSYGSTVATGVTNAAAGKSFIAVPAGQFSTCPHDSNNALQTNNLLLTSRTISQPVTGGQSVSVTVVITFGS